MASVTDRLLHGEKDTWQIFVKRPLKYAFRGATATFLCAADFIHPLALMKFFRLLLLFALALIRPALAQQTDSLTLSNNSLDSLYVQEVEDARGPDKVLHAEPLYIDLIRDLGARKGEKEWNVGLGLTDNNRYDSYELLVEYEWAPVNRLGLEVEVPLTFYSGRSADIRQPRNEINGLKTAIQYSFFVSEKLKMSMAVGYINEVTMNDFRELNRKFVTGNVYSPFFVAAKRWGDNYHTLIYTGPIADQHFTTGHVEWSYQLNSSFHYMIPGTRNFLGMEFNKGWRHGDFDMTIRPQMRVGVADNLLIGIVAGIPVRREEQRLSSFVRLIYEPGHKHK